jgi:glycosyltransferase involved in cell wall biosynthesis
MKDTLPTVSVIMITYGHENFIEQAIKGVLEQTCSFEIELIIANDNSPDQTDLVIDKILKHTPNSNIIKYIKNEINLGAMPNFVNAFRSATGKYVALCEGDDYWIDKNKLQKQIDFLEEDNSYSMTCHNAMVIYEGIEKEPTMFASIQESYEVSLKAILNKWIIPTASMVFRKEYVTPLPNWVVEIYSGDFTLALLLRHSGKIWFFKDVMSVYRVNYSGSSATAIYSEKMEFVSEQQKKLLNHFNETTDYKYSKEIHSKIVDIDRELKFYNLKNKGLIKAFINMPVMFFKKTFKKLVSK